MQNTASGGKDNQSVQFINQMKTLHLLIQRNHCGLERNHEAEKKIEHNQLVKSAFPPCHRISRHGTKQDYHN